MNSLLTQTRQRLVWGALFLTLMVIGSVLVWRQFGEQAQGRRTNVGAPLVGAQNEMQDTNLRTGTRPAPTGEQARGDLLAVYGRAPEFILTERGGHNFSEKNLLGKPWVADFIFTSCAGQCPLMSLEMRKLQKNFPEATGLQFVSFTVDPDRDTPQVLSQYADRYEAEKNRWFFLTGPKQEINRILGQFFLSPAEEPAMHSIRFILVDGEGQIRGYYDSSDPGSIKQLIHDAGILVNQNEAIVIRS